MRQCVARSAALLAAALVALVTPGGASVPVQLLPFINYYEVYLEPYSGLTQKLRGPNSYAATLAMLGLVAAGTLGYLPVNLRDVARAIDSRRRRRRGPGRGRGGRQRRAAAGTDPHTLEQLLLAADPDGCVLRLICEAEFVGPRRAASAEERLVHHLFEFGAGPGRRPPLPAPMERAARRGRQARLRAAPSARCHLLSPRCRASPLEAVRRGTGVRS